MATADLQHPIFEIPGRPRYGPYPPAEPGKELQTIILLLQQILEKLGTPSGDDGGTPPPTIKNLRITTLPLGAANTEVEYQFVVGTKSVIIHARNGNEVRMASQQGIVAADPAVASLEPRFTLKANVAYGQEDLNISDLTQKLYFACGVANEVLEIIRGV